MQLFDKRTIRETVRVIIAVIIFITVINVLILLIQYFVPSTKIDKNYVYHLSTMVKSDMFEIIPTIGETYTINDLIFNFGNSTYKKHFTDTKDVYIEEGLFNYNTKDSNILLRVSWQKDGLNQIVITKVLEIKNTKNRVVYELSQASD